jgi:hypothetical protein
MALKEKPFSSTAGARVRKVKESFRCCFTGENSMGGQLESQPSLDENPESQQTLARRKMKTRASSRAMNESVEMRFAHLACPLIAWSATSREMLFRCGRCRRREVFVLSDDASEYPVPPWPARAHDGLAPESIIGEQCKVEIQVLPFINPGRV